MAELGKPAALQLSELGAYLGPGAKATAGITLDPSYSQVISKPPYPTSGCVSVAIYCSREGDQVGRKARFSFHLD